MSLSRQHRDPVESHRLMKAARRLRLKARAVHLPTSIEESIVTKSRELEKFETQKAQREEHRRFAVIDDKPADPIAASAEAYQTLMTGPDAPDWSRVVVNDFMIAPPATRADVVARLARLDTDHADALAKLNAVQDEQRAVLNAQLDERRAAEEAQAAQEQMPNRLKATLAVVRSYVTPQGASEPVPAPVDHVARGKEALDRAMRRLHGEDVPEPEYEAPAPTPIPGETHTQVTLRARVAPALAQAAAMTVEIEKWSKAVGKSLDALYVPSDGDTRQATDDLMRGVPPTQPNVALVTALLGDVQRLVNLKASMQRTLTSEAAAIERIIARTDHRGAMVVSGDHSAAWYSQERELTGALHWLGMVNADAIAALWTGVRSVTERLEALARIRAAHAGEVVPPLQWQNVTAILNDADFAKRALGDASDGRQTVGAPWSVFSKESN